MTESRLSLLALMKINRDRCNKLSSAENICPATPTKNEASIHATRLEIWDQLLRTAGAPTNFAHALDGCANRAE